MLDEIETWIAGHFDTAALGGPVPAGELGPRRHLYAIIDASRQPMMIPAALEAIASRVSCLYSGNALREFGDNAAWVVELLPSESTLHWLLQQGFNKRWAIFASSRLELAPFVRHLKKFTVVNNERGETLFFRFYDPHVLRQYLPMFDDQQTTSFFRGIDDVFFEDTSRENTIVKFSLSDESRLTKTAVM